MPKKHKIKNNNFYHQAKNLNLKSTPLISKLFTRIESAKQSAIELSSVHYPFLHRFRSNKSSKLVLKIIRS